MPFLVGTLFLVRQAIRRRRSLALNKSWTGSRVHRHGQGLGRAAPTTLDFVGLEG